MTQEIAPIILWGKFRINYFFFLFLGNFD